jgi:hypothetical protein
VVSTGVPVDAVSAAVAHIAHLVDAVAAALNVALPHPLYPFESADCLISAQHDLWARAQVRACCYSLSPVMCLNDRMRLRGFDWTTLQELVDNTTSQSQSQRRMHSISPLRGRNGLEITPRTPLALNTEREQCEIPVVLKAGESGEVVQYSLNPNFGTALVLLQANIIDLCLGAGLHAEELWPPEAMLFNLHLLQKRCEGVVHRSRQVLAACADVPDRAVALYTDVPAASSAHGAGVLRAVADRYGSVARGKAASIESLPPVTHEPASTAHEVYFENEENEWDVVTMESNTAIDQTQIL